GWIAGTLVERGLIDNEDTSLFRIVDSLDEAVAEITGFYRVYHSSRIVGDDLVFRAPCRSSPTTPPPCPGSCCGSTTAPSGASASSSISSINSRGSIRL